MQLLTYEDVTVCISLTLSSRTHTNVQLKTRSHTCVHVCISYFPIILTEKNVSTQLLTYKAAFLKNTFRDCLDTEFISS